MQTQQSFFEALQHKYEESNKTLHKKENELLSKLEAMQLMIESRKGSNEPSYAPRAARLPAPPTRTIHAAPDTLPTGTEDIIMIPDHAPSYTPPRSRLPKVIHAGPDAVPTGTDDIVMIPNFAPSYTPPPSSKTIHVAPRALPTGTADTIMIPNNAPFFKSCTCPPPPEEKSIWKCITSLFTSTKSKTPTPTTNEDVVSQKKDTVSEKSVKPPSVAARGAEIMANINLKPQKNENCMCNPCMFDTDTDFRPQKDDDLCSCSFCGSSKSQVDDNCSGGSCNVNGIKKMQKADDNCSGNSCIVPGSRKLQKADDNCSGNSCIVPGSRKMQKADDNWSGNSNIVPGSRKMQNDDDDFCSCSFCSRIGDNIDNPCCCDYANYTALGNTERGLITNAINIKKNVEDMLGMNHPYLKRSDSSITSQNLFSLKKIYELATDKKKLTEAIKNLEDKIDIYSQIFQQVKDKLQPVAPRKLNLQESLSAESDQTENNAELKLENLLLRNELKDMRLEVRQYLEKMDGPMQYKIESEKYKCVQLEKKLEEAAKKLVKTQEFYEKEMNALKMELYSTATSVHNLTTANQKFKEDLETFKIKSAQLEDDLVRQKISEAETLKRMKAALDAQTNVNVKDECSLHEIARELSKIIKECEPCQECINLPEDLTTAAQLLKSLTDMIDGKLPKDEKYQGIPKKAPPEKEVSVKGSQTSKTSKGMTGNFEKPVAERGMIFGGNTFEEKPVSESEAADAELTSKKSGGEPDQKSVRSGKESQQVRMDLTDVPSVDKKSTGVSELAEKRSVRSAGESQQIKPDTTDVSTPDNKSTGGSVQGDQQSVKSSRDSARVRMDPTDVASVDHKSTKSTGEQDKGDLKSERSLKSTKESASIPSPITDTNDLSLCKCVPSRKSILGKQPTIKQKKPCKCSSKKSKEIDVGKRAATFEHSPSDMIGVTPPLHELDVATTERAADGVDQLWPKGPDRFMLSHQVTASRSRDLLKSETSIKCLKTKENFPFDVDTKVDIIDKPPDGVHVTTTITNSGVLEVITEGPEGVVETTLIYTNSGNVEVVTEVLEYKGRGKACNRNKIKTGSTPRAIEDIGTSGAPRAIENIETPQLKSSASEPARPSGPAVMNPNCKCSDCPGLLPKPEADTKNIEESVIKEEVLQEPSNTQETVEQKSNKEEVQSAITAPGSIKEPSAPEPSVQEKTASVQEETVPNTTSARAENLPAEIVSTVDNAAVAPEKEKIEITQELAENHLSLSVHAENPDASPGESSDAT